MFRWESVESAGRYDVFVLNVGTNVVTREIVSNGVTNLTFSNSFAHGNYRVWVLSLSSGGGEDSGVAQQSLALDKVKSSGDVCSGWELDALIVDFRSTKRTL